MKKFLGGLLMFFALSASAQQNTLLDQSFWRNKPGLSTIKAEVAKGNSASQSNSFSMDPVVYAINASAATDVILYLLQQPGNEPDKLTHDGRTYLHWSAARGNAEVVEYLLKHGAKTDVVDTHGSTPLLFAASGGQQNTSIYDLLIAAGADLKNEINADGANALLLAVANDKDLALTNYFVTKGLSLKSTDAAGNNLFSYAARSGNIDLLKKLVEKGVTVNQFAILMAAQGGAARRGPEANTGLATDQLAIYQYLEGLGVKPTTASKTGQTVLHYVARRPNQQDLIKYFISKGVDVSRADEDGNTALMVAAAGTRDTAVFDLLGADAKNINRVNRNGFSALTFAVRGNSPAVVNYLIAKGADVNITDAKGNNLAYYLIESYGSDRQQNSNKATDFDAKLKMLIANGLNVLSPQKNGNTLYHLAVAKNNLPLVQHLQPLGIDINARNSEGMTALHKAALIAKDDTMLKYLISVGAKKDIGTNFNETAYALASENESLNKNNISVNFLK